jgi:hypothetical protein
MNPDAVRDLAALPWQFQLVLGSGYCAYLVAYVGLRGSHKPVDAIFASIAFGLIASAVLAMNTALGVPLRMATTFAATVAAGMLWRIVGRNLIRWLFRKTHYSWADDSSSAWDHIQEYSGRSPRQLSVKMDDGSYLYCTDTSRVGTLPFGPYILGTNGDVLMYVDQSETADGTVREVAGVFDQEWGDRITWIPAHRIRSIAVRYAVNPDESAAGSWWVKALAMAGLKRRRPGMAAAPVDSTSEDRCS